MSPVGPLIVDANVLFAALIRDGATRRLLLHGQLELHSPYVVWLELERNREMLARRAGVSTAILSLLVAALQARVRSIPKEALEPFRAEALGRTGERDKLDAPYLAACLGLKASLWSHDRRLAATAGVNVVTTGELLSSP